MEISRPKTSRGCSKLTREFHPSLKYSSSAGSGRDAGEALFLSNFISRNLNLTHFSGSSLQHTIQSLLLSCSWNLRIDCEFVNKGGKGIEGIQDTPSQLMIFTETRLTAQSYPSSSQLPKNCKKCLKEN
ncbi:unnamed protein product [Allacma fusca]|uniref:Uncharacterized protein n=1 Tax=Allacma fusca TaxID=39272 RepID=A0A8J2J0A0_9HEXA|nr:unnamed protein product [Allacma fusca]